MALDIDGLVFAPATTDGLPPLVPVVAQHARTGEVLMVGWSDRSALDRTLADGRLWFYSRSRRTLWMKGETSGNVLRVESMRADCDGDTVLARVRPQGPVCHTGTRACFDSPPTLRALADVIAERLAGGHADEGESHTRRLARDRNLRLKKLGEETAELVLACADAERSANGGGSRVAAEAADLLYHVMVACAAAGVGIEAILDELESRLDRSGARSTSATSRERAISSPS